MSSSSEGRYNLYSQGSSGWTSMRNEEFQEEEIWGNFINERREFSSNFNRNKESSSPIFSPRRLPTAAKMIQRSSKSSIQEPKIIQHSAPVNIPDWSKIYGTNFNKNLSRRDDFDYDDDNYDGGGHNLTKNSSKFDEEDDDDDDDDDEGEMMPPHEWIAKKLERSKISSFSVCEGVGRTLKGRDLSRVRNAILSKTGFLE